LYTDIQRGFERTIFLKGIDVQKFTQLASLTHKLFVDQQCAPILNIEPGQTELVKRLGVHVQSLHVDTDITESDTVKQIFGHSTAFD
jgi:hypothetical protein